MYQENLNTDQKRLLSFLMAYKNKKEIKDEYGNKIIMFFNEHPRDISILMGKYKYNKLSRKSGTINEDIMLKDGIIQLNQSLKNVEKNHKFNVLNFVEFGQRRGRNWQEFNYDLYYKLMPKPKRKIINPKKRKKYVI
jgi:menaquinone-dependent protoporphyrinogen IX oxidase